MRELLTFIAFFAVCVGADQGLHHGKIWWARRCARKAEKDATLNDLNPISPLYREECHMPYVQRPGRHRYFAFIAMFGSTAVHPATLEAVKGYVIHLFVYSGYFMPGH